jgi:hypothetical protein
LEPKIVSRRAAGIDDEWSRLKYGGADHNCDIGAQLANGGAFGVPNKPARFANAIFSGVRALSQGRDLLGYLLELSCSVKIRSLGFRFNMGELSAPRLDRDLWWPVTDGRYSQDDCERSYNGLIVVVALDPLKPSFDEQKRSSKEGGAVILIIIVGDLFVVLWFYQAQR